MNVYFVCINIDDSERKTGDFFCFNGTILFASHRRCLLIYDVFLKYQIEWHAL